MTQNENCNDCWGSGWETQFVTPCITCNGTGKKQRSAHYTTSVTPLEEGKPSEKPDFEKMANEYFKTHYPVTSNLDLQVKGAFVSGCNVGLEAKQYYEDKLESRQNTIDSQHQTITSLQSEVEKHKRKAIAYRKEGDVIIANLTAEVERLNKQNAFLIKAGENLANQNQELYHEANKIAAQEPVKGAEDVLKSYVKRVGYPDMNVADAITAMEEYANQFKPKKA